MITSKPCHEMALDIIKIFPEAKTVKEAFDLAREAEMFSNDNEAMAVWGRLMRLLPQSVA